MKKLIKSILCFVVSLTLIFAIMPKFKIKTLAADKGTEVLTVSRGGGYSYCGVELDLYNATSVSDNTATYVVDRYFYTDMSQLETIYKVSMWATGIYASTNAASTGYDLSNTCTNNNVPLSTSGSSNAGPVPFERTGYMSGAIPEAGSSTEFTVSASVSTTFYFNGFYPSDSASVSATVQVIAVDTTNLRELVSSCSGYRSACWTSATWSAFSSALSNAQTVINSSDARQSDIDSAYQSLLSAKDNLVHDGLLSACEYCRNGGSSSAEIQVDSYLNLSYANNGERSLYDLYLPKNTSGDISMILFIHGGAWIFGSKEDMTAEAFNACKTYGVATAALSYRYASLDVHGWDILNDIETCVANIKQTAASKGLNIKKMMVYGFSAGAHLSLMYAYTKAESSPIEPVCVFSKSGPAYLCNDAYMQESSQMPMVLSCISGFYFTAETRQYAMSALLNMSPSHYVTSKSVPTVVCHGMQDSIVPFSDSVVLNQALNNAGVEHEYITFPNSNHGLESDPDKSVIMQRALETYIDRYLLDVQPTTVHNYQATIIPATCTTEGYTRYTCVDCGKYYLSDFVYPSHTNLPEVRENVVEATCTTGGSFEGVVYCSVCGEEVSRTPVTVSPKGHTTVIDQAVDATCTSDGLTQGSHCSVCGEILVAQEDITALGHTPMDPVRENETAPTCSEFGGYDDVVYCSVCNEEVSRTHTQIAKTTHKAGAWEVTIPATYVTEGQQVKRCTGCGLVLATKPISVLEPEFSANEGSLISFDESCSVLKNIPQGTTDISRLLTLGGCTVEASDAVIATGTQITIKNLAGAVLATYTASVSGDLNGDGYVDAFDTALISEYINTFTQPEGDAFMEAADIFNDGYLDATDLAYLIYSANFE